MLILHLERYCIFTWVLFHFPNFINGFMPEKNCVFFSSCTSSWRTHLKYPVLYFTALMIHLRYRLVTSTCVCWWQVASEGTWIGIYIYLKNERICIEFMTAKEAGPHSYQSELPSTTTWAHLKGLCVAGKISCPCLDILKLLILISNKVQLSFIAI